MLTNSSVQLFPSGFCWFYVVSFKCPEQDYSFIGHVYSSLSVWNLVWADKSHYILICWDSIGVITLNGSSLTINSHFQGFLKLSGVLYYTLTWHVTTFLFAASGQRPVVNVGV